MAGGSIPVPGGLGGAEVARPEAFDGTWLEKLHSWVVTVDHKKLGILYVLYALAFFVVGGIEAMLIRIQLFYPGQSLRQPGDVQPHLYHARHHDDLLRDHADRVWFRQLPDAADAWRAGHGVPAVERVQLLDVGAWAEFCSTTASLAEWACRAPGSAPDVGWFAYAPLTARAFSRGHSTDYWTLSLLVAGVGSIGAAINFIATAFCMRCKGMTLFRMPLFVWVYVVMSGLVILAVSPLTAAQAMLMIDRYLGGHFFDTQAGGSAVVWVHFFWIFGHPEVYVLVMPAFAIMNEVIPVFSRKAIFGYPAMVAASVGIGFVSLGVWAHHMFTVGMTSISNAFFALSTMLVGIPTGIKIFNWVATMWGGKIRFRVPMLFSVAFLVQFLIAGLTGIMLSVAPFNWQLHNSYFVIAHFHYVIVGGILFALFAGIYYWFPKVTGRMLDERLGKWHFWLFLLGFHLTFDFMHIPGILGMPRSIYTYEANRGWTGWNQIVSVGAAVQAIATAIFVFNLVYSCLKGREAGADPWDAWTLEWTTTSPPPPYNFATEPVVASRRPLWDLKHPDDPDEPLGEG